MLRTSLKIFLSLSILTLIIILAPKTNAHWAKEVNEAETQFFASVSIGSWDFIDSHPYDDWNLNIWQDEEILNQYIPEGQPFTYNENLYISLHSGYNPYWHGLPTEYSLPWAFVSTALEWVSGTNYRVNSVVLRNGRYFIANHVYVGDDWFVNDPLDWHGYIWSEWREIEPLPEEYFEYFPETTFKNYIADPNDVTYK